MSEMSADDPPVISSILERFKRTQEKIFGQQTDTDEQPKKQSVFEASESRLVKADGLSLLPQPEISIYEAKNAALSWIVTPTFVDPKKTHSFSDLGVSEPTITRLKELGIYEAFAVQTAVIPDVLKTQRSTCSDPPSPILVNSFTGSGKTLAYTIPIVDTLRTRRVPRIRALILLPTKVLIQQVHQVLEQMSNNTPLRVMSLKTDRTLSKEKLLLEKDVPDIIIATPGRLVEHLGLTKSLLDDLQIMVIDEADRLVGQSFQNWTERLREVLPVPSRPQSAVWKRSVQRLVFSATLTRDSSKLHDLQINTDSLVCTPRLYVVGLQELDGRDEFSLPQQLFERMVKVRSLEEKPLVLTDELIKCDGRVIVFVRSNEAAARLSRLVNLIASSIYHQLVDAKPCTGEMRPQERRRVLRDFAAQTTGVLVCTDMIARGIDMHIDYVINYDVPYGAREYVHRVGRTARAGADGSAWTLVAPGYDTKHFWDIQTPIGRSSQITEETVEVGVDEAKYKAALAELGQEVMGK